MATFKEIAKFILSQPEDIQNCEANFMSIGPCNEEDLKIGLEPDIESVDLSGQNLKVVKVVDKHFAPMIFGAPTCYISIAKCDDEIPDEFEYEGY